MGKRKNRAVMLHALANIEQWAYVTTASGCVIKKRLTTSCFHSIDLA